MMMRSTISEFDKRTVKTQEDVMRAYRMPAPHPEMEGIKYGEELLVFNPEDEEDDDENAAEANVEADFQPTAAQVESDGEEEREDDDDVSDGENDNLGHSPAGDDKDQNDDGGEDGADDIQTRLNRVLGIAAMQMAQNGEN